MREIGWRGREWMKYCNNASALGVKDQNAKFLRLLKELGFDNNQDLSHEYQVRGVGPL